MPIRLFAIARTLFFGSLFIVLWTWFLPRWVAASQGIALDARWRPAAVLFLAVGGAVVVRCFWDFSWTGHGTPAPWDAPRRLVVRGMYRYVRNPMYAGMALVLIGEALLLRSLMHEVLIILAVYCAMVTAFVLLYEEPELRRQFGDDYREYCRNVRRWIPRLKPFDSARLVP